MNEDDEPRLRPAQLVLCLGAERHTLPTTGRRPLLVGRDPGGDVVIRDPAVSRHHALVWEANGEVFVRDLGSALGTRVGARQLSAGDLQVAREDDDIVLAGRVVLRWRRVSSAPGPALGAVVTIPGQTTDPFGLEVTAPPPDDGGLIAVTVSCAPSGPREVCLEDDRGHELRVRGESRVVMLYLLAEQAARAEQGLASSAWVEDRKLVIGLWGARGPELPSSRLNTVISRVRGQLRKALFPEELIQKDGGRTRLGPSHGAIVIDRAASR